jgi:hypothetical protein
MGISSSSQGGVQGGGEPAQALRSARVEAAGDLAATTLRYRRPVGEGEGGGGGDEASVDMEQALVLVAQGTITPATPVWSEGMSEWMPWAEAQKFFMRQAAAAASLVDDRSYIDRLMFPMTLADSSYGTGSFPGELAWVPRAEGGGGHVPVLLLPRRGQPTASRLIVYFHGNGTDCGQVHPVLLRLGEQCCAHVVAVEYPGYGVSSSGGTTCAARVDRDCDTVLRYITDVAAGLGWGADSGERETLASGCLSAVAIHSPAPVSQPASQPASQSAVVV